MLTLKRLKELLEYSSDTGLFTNKVNRGGLTVGSLAGGICGVGYILISIDGVQYYGHILAWFYHYGAMPQKGIDHKDHDKVNNRISNLRESTQSQNLGNMRKKAKSETGIKGVYKTTDGKKFRAYIKHNYTPIYLGRFDTVEEAKEAYNKASQKYFGEFAHE